ncbi:MAG: hypothetical protein MZW92_18275 [Comamonadaceae bacterium]|nr:hypothetical protein [Comamonadaceae bacterium]
MDIRNRAETDRTLAEAREALLGHAAANGRLAVPRERRQQRPRQSGNVRCRRAVRLHQPP